jgi:hypothetical protein
VTFKSYKACETFGHCYCRDAYIEFVQDHRNSLSQQPSKGDSDEAEILTAKTEASAGGETAVILAAQRGYDGVLGRLLKAGAEVKILENRGVSALHWAAWGNHSLPVDLLIAAPQVDIDIDIPGQRLKTRLWWELSLD